MEDAKDKVIKHLRRIDGQIRGIESMVLDGRNCSDILYQIVAAREALKSVGVEIAKAHLCSCVSYDDNEEAEIGKILKIIASLS